MADVDAALMQQVFDIAIMRKLLETANALVKADRLWEPKCTCYSPILEIGFEVLERRGFGHTQTRVASPCPAQAKFL